MYTAVAQSHLLQGKDIFLLMKSIFIAALVIVVVAIPTWIIGSYAKTKPAALNSPRYKSGFGGMLWVFIVGQIAWFLRAVWETTFISSEFFFMLARNEGTIVNISSIAGRKTFDQHSVYCGTKYAVHAITESMRKEVASSNVRFIVIAPGVVETPLLSHTSDQGIKDNYNNWKETIDGGLDVGKIADCVLFAYNMPQDICVREIVVAKTKQQD